MTAKCQDHVRSMSDPDIRIRVAAITRDAITLRQDLDLCLKGEAQDWWINQLSPKLV